MTITKHAALLLMTVVGFTGLVHAKMNTTIKAQVPFNFVANGQTMAAGECTIEVEADGRTVLLISSGKHHVLALPLADVRPNPRGKTALLFHRYGDRYFLVSIKREAGTGYQLHTSRAERELQARNTPGQVFTLLASAR